MTTMQLFGNMMMSRKENNNNKQNIFPFKIKVKISQRFIVKMKKIKTRKSNNPLFNKGSRSTN